MPSGEQSNEPMAVRWGFLTSLRSVPRHNAAGRRGCSAVHVACNLQFVARNSFGFNDLLTSNSAAFELSDWANATPITESIERVTPRRPRMQYKREVFLRGPSYCLAIVRATNKVEKRWQAGKVDYLHAGEVSCW